MFPYIIWRLLILETFMMGALCRFCLNEHPQKQFCISEFVLKVKFAGEIHVSEGHGYRMKIIRVFKGNFQELSITHRRYINVVMAAEYELMNGKKYLIFGHNKDGNIYTDICGGTKPWGMTTKYYRRGLSKFYKTGCDCIYEMPKFCVRKSCHWDYSFMVRRSGKCNWVEKIPFRMCQKRLIIIPPSE